MPLRNRWEGLLKSLMLMLLVFGQWVIVSTFRKRDLDSKGSGFRYSTPEISVVIFYVDSMTVCLFLNGYHTSSDALDTLINGQDIESDSLRIFAATRSYLVLASIRAYMGILGSGRSWTLFGFV